MIKGLFISARKLGDAIINQGFLARCATAAPHIQWDVCCRPDFSVLFRPLGNVRGVVCARLPVGGNKPFGVIEATETLSAILKLRRRSFAFSLALVGDREERWFSMLVGARERIFPQWAPDHPIRPMLGRTRVIPIPGAWYVPKERINIYDVASHLCAQLCARFPGDGEQSAGWPVQSAHSVWDWSSHGRRNPSGIIGIHPFASHPSRCWAPEGWREVIARLKSRNHPIRLFGAPWERPRLLDLARDLVPGGCVVTRPIAGFLQELENVGVLVGGDSFSVHAAHSRGVKTVTISGSGNFSIWRVPDGEVVWSEGGCAKYPCYDQPACTGSDEEYVCIRSITADQVCAAIEQVFPGVF